MGQAKDRAALAAEIAERCATLLAQPGDYMVYRTHENLSDAQIDNLGKVLQRAFPNHRVIILDNNADVQPVQVPAPQLPELRKLADQTQTMLEELQRLVRASTTVVNQGEQHG